MIFTGEILAFILYIIFSFKCLVFNVGVVTESEFNYDLLQSKLLHKLFLLNLLLWDMKQHDQIQDNPPKYSIISTFEIHLDVVGCCLKFFGNIFVSHIVEIINL